MGDDPILCFQHCEDDVNILCLELPDTCPICLNSLSNTLLKIPPFRLPTPFCESNESPYSIVIKPTKGNFLSDYINGEDLHVGITDSHGDDEHPVSQLFQLKEDHPFRLNCDIKAIVRGNGVGISRHEDGWRQVLAVLTISKRNFSITSLWDTKLQEFCAYDRWDTSLYDETKHNCYTFGLEFLQLMHDQIDLNLPCIQKKSTFIQEMVIPQTKQAAQYITHYRKLVEEQTIVQYNTSL